MASRLFSHGVFLLTKLCAHSAFLSKTYCVFPWGVTSECVNFLIKYLQSWTFWYFRAWTYTGKNVCEIQTKRDLRINSTLRTATSSQNLYVVPLTRLWSDWSATSLTSCVQPGVLFMFMYSCWEGWDVLFRVVSVATSRWHYEAMKLC